jgi:hypothetical protein
MDGITVQSRRVFIKRINRSGLEISTFISYTIPRIYFAIKQKKTYQKNYKRKFKVYNKHKKKFFFKPIINLKNLPSKRSKELQKKIKKKKLRRISEIFFILKYLLFK